MSRDEEVAAILSAHAVAAEAPVVKKVSTVKKKLTQAEFLTEVFGILDIKLNLHFTSHTASADLDTLLRDVSRLVHKQVSIGVVLQILYIWPDCFKVFETTNGRYLIDLPKVKLDGMGSRKGKFQVLVETWIMENGDETVPCATIDDSVNDPLNNKIRVMKNSNKRLKNNSKDFEFKEKIETDKSMTLLERIKAKERANKTELGPATAVDSKLESIYNILYSLHIANAKNNYTLVNLSQKIKDSYKTSIHDDDIAASLTNLSEIIDAIQIVEVNKLKVVKFAKLNRDDDLTVIRQLYKYDK